MVSKKNTLMPIKVKKLNFEKGQENYLLIFLVKSKQKVSQLF